jgi:hypothetical protein
MTISELIIQLEQIKKEHGDLTVDIELEDSVWESRTCELSLTTGNVLITSYF